MTTQPKFGWVYKQPGVFMKLGIFEIDLSSVTFIKASSCGKIDLELTDGTKINIRLSDLAEDVDVLSAIEAIKSELDLIKRPLRMLIELEYE